MIERNSGHFRGDSYSVELERDVSRCCPECGRLTVTTSCRRLGLLWNGGNAGKGKGSLTPAWESRSVRTTRCIPPSSATNGFKGLPRTGSSSALSPFSHMRVDWLLIRKETSMLLTGIVTRSRPTRRRENCCANGDR